MSERATISIENDHLIVTVSVEGGHIAAITEKTSGINALWVPPWPSIEPSTYSRERNPEYGDNAESKLLAGILGHNLALDIFGTPSESEYAAGLTVHGESSVVPYRIESSGARLLATAHLPLALLDFEREIGLAGGVVRIRETVTNLTSMDRPIAWTQHVTLGPPFIEPGKTRLSLTATESMVFPSDLSPDHQRYRPGATFTWPLALNKDGSKSDLSTFPAFDHSAGVTAQLVDRESACFAAWHPDSQLLFGYAWKRSDFPWISLWEENRSRTMPPWNGETIAWGVEFGVSPFAEGRRRMIERRSLFGVPTFRWLPARASLEVEYRAFARHSDKMPLIDSLA